MAAPTSSAASAPVFGTASLKIPPRWDPSAAQNYPFKKWCQDVVLWSLVTDLPIAQQAPAVVLQQTGTVREVLRTLDTTALANGAMLDINDGRGPTPQTGLTIVLYLLTQKFQPLGYEQNILASSLLLSFTRQAGESIDAALCRYDTIRYKAASEAGLNLGSAGTAHHLLRALRVQPQLWPLLTQAFGGSLPQNEQELSSGVKVI